MDFLRKLHKIYEIVIFTAAMKEVKNKNYKKQYADNILDVLDQERELIDFRLYRQHTSACGLGFIKVRYLFYQDLSKIGRDNSKTIIVDNIPENFRLQPFNGFAIKTFIDDMRDTNLIDLQKILYGRFYF